MSFIIDFWAIIFLVVLIGYFVTLAVIAVKEEQRQRLVADHLHRSVHSLRLKETRDGTNEAAGDEPGTRDRGDAA